MIRAVLVLALCLVGCAVQPRTRGEIDRHGKPKVTQTGEAKEPGKATVETTVTTLPIPAGSKIEIKSRTFSPASEVNENGSTAGILTLSQPSELRVETRREAVEGAKTPEPRPPPSPVEIARGKGVKWFYGAAVVCAVCAVVAFVRKYFYAGLCFAAGAVAIPLGVNVVSEEWVIRAAGVLVVAGFAFVAAWKIIAARHGLGNQAGTVAK